MIARTHGAAALVDQLPREPRVDVGAGVHLPLAPATLLVAARGVAERRMSGPAQARLQLPGGGWLAAQASCMIEASGAIAATALVIKAAGAGDIAAIALRAHRLTAREAEIARMVAQGLGTIAMAHQLHLSVHTLRDYIKAIFAKTGVSTRGELVAKLLGTAALADPGRPLGDGDDGSVIG